MVQQLPVSIVGVGESRHGIVPDATADELMAEASLSALEDAGLEVGDVDGLFTTSAYYSMPTMTLAEHLGVTPTYIDSSSLGGASFVSYVGHAAAALSAGLCDVALIAYGSTQRSDGAALKAISEPSPFESGTGYRFPLSAYALAASRHMGMYGTTREQLAQVAVSAREWANMTPNAYKTGPLTVDDVLSSKMVSYPLTVRDCCLVTDGGAAFVMTRRERTKDLDCIAIDVHGFAETNEHRHISEMPELEATPAQSTGRRAFGMAGLTPDDMDLALLYDAFTISVPLFLEDLGFCDKGDGGSFIEAGHISPGGRLPVNTNGGGLSYTHPGMYGAFLVVEAVRQLRHVAGERQVSDARFAAVHGCGATLSSHATTILGIERT